MRKPLSGEYNPYFDTYFKLVPDGDLIELLKQNMGETLEFFLSLPPEKEAYRYAPEKWTVKEVLNHINDAERVFAYRSLVAARKDGSTDLMSFDENTYADNADVSHRSLKDLVEEFKVIRESSIYLMINTNPDQSSFKARNGNFNFTADAGICFMIGHVIHHINVLKDRYL